MRQALFFIISILFFHCAINVFAQPMSVMIHASDGYTTYNLQFGTDINATACIDSLLDEREQPPIPPLGVFDVRWIDPPGQHCLGQGLLRDYRKYFGPTQVDTFELSFRLSVEAGSAPLSIWWNNLNGAFSQPVRMTDIFGGTLLYADMKAETSTNASASLGKVYIIVGGDSPPSPLPPNVLTTPGIPLNQSSVSLMSEINAYGNPTYARFDWGLTDSYGNTTTLKYTGYATSPTTFSESIDSLLPQTTYHFRVVAQNVNGTSIGNDQTVTTGMSGIFFISPLTLTDQATTGTIHFGIHSSATKCIDGALGESELSPVPSTGVFDFRFEGSPCLGNGVDIDLHPMITTAQIDTYRIRFQKSSLGSASLVFSWTDLSPYYSGNLLLKDVYDLLIVNVDMKSTPFYILTEPLNELLIVAEHPTTCFTYKADPIGDSSSTLRGAFNPNGVPTAGWFQWGTSVSYSDSTPRQFLGDGTSLTQFTRQLVGLQPNTTYHYRAMAQNSIGTSFGVDQMFKTQGTVGVNESQIAPKSYSLWQNFPNPFNPTTAIRYDLPTESFVTLKVYDVLGREVATLVHETKEAGTHSVNWSGENVPSGLYFYRIQTPNFYQMKKMLLLR